MATVDNSPPVHLPEIIGAMSLGVDLGFSQPMEHVLRQCWISLRLSDELGLSEEEKAAVYYTALLTNVGCHTDAHEQTKWFGDDIALRSDKYEVPLHGVRSAISGLRRLGSGSPPLDRLRLGVAFALSGHRDLAGMIESHAKMACNLATELGLSPNVQDSVASSYEQWDGNGWPGHRSGDAIPIPARVAQFAEFAEVAHRTGGITAATDLATRLAGSQFDPEVAQAFITSAAEIVGGTDESDAWDQVIARQPITTAPLSNSELDRALVAVADFVDLKSPYFLGHARGVGQLVAEAGPQLRLPEATVKLTERAAWTASWGRLGISNAIWDKAGPLGPGEWERVRMQPYLTERILRLSPGLAVIGGVAGQIRERLDGSGYPRGLAGDDTSMATRLLVAADVYQALVEPRPHRPAFTRQAAATQLRDEVRAGRIDENAAEAVLAAAGHPGLNQPRTHVDLTSRETEVLRLVARGLSSKQIADQLSISPKTARNHIEHIYSKTGATNRVAASLFAIRNGLFADPPH
jgi:HD-GYP domain-containing protein (c-di-GMP phosphodiesterase class II)